MPKEFDPRRLDVRRFAEEAAQVGSDAVLREFPRLRDEAQGSSEERRVRWGARGELRNPRHLEPEVWVHVEAEATLPLVCQRCLLPVEIALAVDRSFRFVADESTAAAQDDEAEEDVLALSRAFDLLELVEDELLMALPVAPRHDVCPQPVKMSAADPEFLTAEATRENPFSVLGRLRTRKE